MLDANAVPLVHCGLMIFAVMEVTLLREKEVCEVIEEHRAVVT